MSNELDVTPTKLVSEEAMAAAVEKLSQNMRQRLREAHEAVQEYQAQQQIIWLLIERCGGSVTFGLESLTTRRMGTIISHRDEDTGAVTFSLNPHQNLSA